MQYYILIHTLLACTFHRLIAQSWSTDHDIQLLNSANDSLFVLSNNFHVDILSLDLVYRTSFDIDCDARTLNCTKLIPVLLAPNNGLLSTIHRENTNCLLVTSDKVENYRSTLSLPETEELPAFFFTPETGVMHVLLNYDRIHSHITIDIYKFGLTRNSNLEPASLEKIGQFEIPRITPLTLINSQNYLQTDSILISIFSSALGEKTSRVVIDAVVSRVNNKGNVFTKLVKIECPVSRTADCTSTYSETKVTVKHAAFSNTTLTLAVYMSSGYYDFCQIEVQPIITQAENCRDDCGTISMRSLDPIDKLPYIESLHSLSLNKEWLYINTGKRLLRYIVSENDEMHLSHDFTETTHGMNNIIVTEKQVLYTSEDTILSMDNIFDCSSAQTCFQCLSNVFPWYQKCAWSTSANSCVDKSIITEDADYSNDICPPRVKRVEKSFLYTNAATGNKYQIGLEGENFGIRGNLEVYCNLGANQLEVLTATRSYDKRSMTLNIPDSLYLDYEQNAEADSWKCTIVTELEDDSTYGITTGGNGVIPQGIYFIDAPTTWKKVPESIPASTGFMVPVNGKGLSNGKKCFPRLKILNMNNDEEIVKEQLPHNNTENYAVFLFPAFPGGITSKEAKLVIELDTDIQRQIGIVSISDPIIESIEQNTSIASGGLPIILTGQNLTSLQKPALEFTFYNNSQILSIQETGAFSISSTELRFNSVKAPIDFITSEKVKISLRSSKKLTELICGEETETTVISPAEYCGFSKDLLPDNLRTLVYYPNPWVNNIPNPNALLMKNSKDSELNVSYNGILEEWFLLDYVKVWIGKQQCIIHNHTSTNLSCTLPPYYEVVQQEDIIVQIGDYRQKIGTFYYEPEEGRIILYITLGASTAFIFVVSFVSAIVYCSVRAKRKERLRRLEESRGAGRLHFNIRYREMVGGAEPDYVIDEEEEQVLNTCFTEEAEKKYMQYYRENRVKPEWIRPTTEKALGEGAFGKVFRMTMECPPMDNDDICRTLIIAVKFSKEKDPDKVKHTWKELLDEGNSMRDFEHRNILGMLGFSVIVQPGTHPTNGSIPAPELCIILPYMTDGDVKSFIVKNKAILTNRQRLKFSLHAALGMDYLQERGMLHGDLAARNCMLTRLSPGQEDEELVLKVADFGLSKSEGSQQENMNKPICWCSPELLQGGKLSVQTDIWAYGVLVWEIFTSGAQPFRHLFDANERMDLRVVARNIIKGETPCVDPMIIELAVVREIMSLCWSRNPDDRPQFSEISDRLEDVLCLARDSPPSNGTSGGHVTNQSTEDTPMRATHGTTVISYSTLLGDSEL